MREVCSCIGLATRESLDTRLHRKVGSDKDSPPVPVPDLIDETECTTEEGLEAMLGKRVEAWGLVGEGEGRGTTLLRTICNSKRVVQSTRYGKNDQHLHHEVVGTTSRLQ